ncbi:transferase [Streptomyces pharetrae CZA14]|uniref:Transferase n=1 Tax=Streptomyces pharetrae CZA14 TaxID=1144883 RepID=A0ABX3YH93_9ACTN|nr:transferase [Streptomyces pharetrae CZA14]
MTAYAVVIPTLAPDSLADCLAALAASIGPKPRQIVLVDDRAHPEPGSLDHPLGVLGDLRPRATVVASGGRGPAAARNTGLRAVTTPWAVFLADDVQPGPHWCAQLDRDLAADAPDIAGSQGVIAVPLPGGRAPTETERETAARARARWSTADMAYRTDALKQARGFDERFRCAHRADIDLALRLLDAGLRIRQGRRTSMMPARPDERWASLRAQRRHADDALMTRLHGPRWWHRAVAPPSRPATPLAVTATGTTACALALTGHPRAALAAGLGWAAGTAAIARARIAPGPRSRDEVTTLLVTSALNPPAAAWHRLAGRWRHRAAQPWRDTAG